jgi:predicted metal-dependent hydrolase
MSQLELFPHFESGQCQQPGDLQDSLPAALPAYKVRESDRAKHVSIKISVEGEVEVVVPPRFERAKLPDILEKRKDWILKTRSRLLGDRASTVSDWQVEKPETIVLRWRSMAIDEANLSDSALESWSVLYQPGAGSKTLCIPSARGSTKKGRLTIRGNTEHLPNCQGVLKQWLAYRAQRDLAPWLRQLGFELNLPCRQISVRGQKTRWASCSNRKDISLNYKLLFLPRPLVHYVLVHELCHTVHMDHSAKFWALVGEKQPDYQQWRDQLKTGWRYVPRWVEAG